MPQLQLKLFFCLFDHFLIFNQSVSVCRRGNVIGGDWAMDREFQIVFVIENGLPTNYKSQFTRFGSMFGAAVWLFSFYCKIVFKTVFLAVFGPFSLKSYCSVWLIYINAMGRGKLKCRIPN